MAVCRHFYHERYISSEFRRLPRTWQTCGVSLGACPNVIGDLPIDANVTACMLFLTALRAKPNTRLPFSALPLAHCAILWRIIPAIRYVPGCARTRAGQHCGKRQEDCSSFFRADRRMHYVQRLAKRLSLIGELASLLKRSEVRR